MLLIAIFLIQEFPKIINYYNNNTRVYFFDVGHGDASLIKTYDNRLILIDGGPGNQIIEKASNLLPFWVNKIDLIIVSHSHSDHITGLINIFQRYEINCLVYRADDEPISETEKAFRQIVTKSSAQKIEYYDENQINECLNQSKISNIEKIAKDVFSNKSNINSIENSNMENSHMGNSNIGNNNMENNNIENSGYFIKNFALDRDQINSLKGKNENYESIITLFSQDEKEVLFMADAETPVQELLIEYLPNNIEVIKVPHQGSADSYYPKAIELFNPSVGVVFVGEKNKYGHPHKSTVKGYQSRDIQLLRTDIEGDISIDL